MIQVQNRYKGAEGQMWCKSGAEVVQRWYRAGAEQVQRWCRACAEVMVQSRWKGLVQRWCSAFADVVHSCMCRVAEEVVQRCANV